MANEDILLRFKSEIQRGIKANIVQLDDEEKNVAYIAQNKKFRLSDPEELVRAIAYVSLILDYGYSVDQIAVEFTVPHRVPNIHADIVVFRDKAKKTPFIVVERAGSVCLNSFGAFLKWIPASVMPPSGWMAAH